MDFVFLSAMTFLLYVAIFAIVAQAAWAMCRAAGKETPVQDNAVGEPLAGGVRVGERSSPVHPEVSPSGWS
jgi:hypothetical protein